MTNQDSQGNKEKQQIVGKVEWMDLTVIDAEFVKDFYCDVVGWEFGEVPMGSGSYKDYEIKTPDSGETVAGICHARGENSNLPPQWLLYVRVKSVQESAQKCVESGGEVVDGPRPLSGQNFCVIKDPTGAVLALISKN